MKHLLAVLTLISLTGCATKEAIQGEIKISLSESYSISELYPALLEANKLIGHHQLDSLAKVSIGISLLDQFNAETAKSDTVQQNSINDFPLFQILIPHGSMGNDSNFTIDTSAVIGMLKDSATLCRYLIEVRSVFPKDIEWVITGNVAGYRCLHALKKGSVIIPLNLSDVDSVIVHSFTSVGLDELLASINDSYKPRYWTQLKLNKELLSQLPNGVFSLIMHIGSSTYSGSVVNLAANPNSYVMIGEIGVADLGIVRSNLPGRLRVTK